MAHTPPKSDDNDRARSHKRSGWLRRLLRTVFAQQVQIKRKDGKLAVSLEQDRSVQGRGAGAAARAGAHSDDAMHAELSALFKAAPGSRQTLRHLAAVRHSLKHKDSKGLFLYGAEPAQVRTALRQLDGLMPEQPTPGLTALRARMVDALGTRERRIKRLEMLSPRSDLMQGERVEVRETSTTDFDRALQRQRD